jgi:predicted ArsR family transcriptional regulator
MVTPEESQLLLDLWSPSTCADLAGKLNIDEKSVRSRLENLARKKIITEKMGAIHFITA